MKIVAAAKIGEREKMCRQDVETDDQDNREAVDRGYKDRKLH